MPISSYQDTISAPTPSTSKEKISSESTPELIGKPIGNDRLFTISDVANILNVSSVTASMIMKDSGYSITIGRRVYILESNFIHFLNNKKEEQNERN